MLRHASALAGVVLLLAAAPAGASPPEPILINNGLAPPSPANVIDAPTSFPEDVIFVLNMGCTIWWETCPLPWDAPTTVALVEGGSVFILAAYSTSTITMSGGSVEYLEAYDSSSITVSGGSVTFLLPLSGASTATMSGGSVAFLSADQSSTVTLRGGSVRTFWVSTSSAATLRGGSVETFRAWSTASDVTLSGASIAHLETRGSAAVTLRGGSVTADLEAAGSSQVAIVGTDFAVDDVPVGVGPIAATSGTLTGTLQSGDWVDFYFCHDGCTDPEEPATGLITLVPEPGFALLSTTAMLSVAAVRRRRGTHR